MRSICTYDDCNKTGQFLTVDLLHNGFGVVLDDSQFVLQSSLLRVQAPDTPVLTGDLPNFQFQPVFISID